MTAYSAFLSNERFSLSGLVVGHCLYDTSARPTARRLSLVSDARVFDAHTFQSDMHKILSIQRNGRCRDTI